MKDKSVSKEPTRQLQYKVIAAVAAVAYLALFLWAAPRLLEAPQYYFNYVWNAVLVCTIGLVAIAALNGYGERAVLFVPMMFLFSVLVRDCHALAVYHFGADYIYTYNVFGNWDSIKVD